MAGAVLDLIGDKQLLTRTKQQARERAVSKFDSAVIIPHYIEGYNRLMGRGGVAAGGT